MSTLGVLIVGIVVVVMLICVAAIADAHKEAEEELWAVGSEDFTETVEDFQEHVCGRVYRDMDARRQGRTVRVLDVTWVEGKGWMCSVLAAPSGFISDIRENRLEDPNRFSRVEGV